MPPTVSIDLTSAPSVYRQIVHALRSLLVNGALRPADTLPPVRQLAIDLGIHHDTVAEVYRELEGEGWLDLRHRCGAIVLAREPPREA
ncbi:MAG TPA: GntR family transcriptional regulator [Polyangia bacterium]|nr:GntR family transcriptional regulator [Polyangia bacterium]